MSPDSSSKRIRSADPFAAAGYSGHPDCRMQVATDESDFPLSPAEEDRVARIRSEASQRELRGSLVVRRRLIAQIAGCEPGRVSLMATEDGAPVLMHPEGWTVSLANKSDVTIVAMRPVPASIGVDLEIVKDINWPPILSMICSDDERGRLEGRIDAHSDRLRAFFRLWTIKEAVLKATNRGFRAGPKGIEARFEILEAPGSGELSAFGNTYRFWTVDVDAHVVSLVEQRA